MFSNLAPELPDFDDDLQTYYYLGLEGRSNTRVWLEFASSRGKVVGGLTTMVLDSIIPGAAPSDPDSQAEMDSIFALLVDGMVSPAPTSRRLLFLASSSLAFQRWGEWGFP